MDWGITVWPTLAATEAGNARRAKAAGVKRDKPLKSEEGEGLAARTQGSATTRSRGKEKAALIEPPPTTSGSLMANSIAVQGRSYQVLIESLHPYLAALSDPAHNSMDLRLRRAELRAIQEREAGESLYIANMVNERGKVVDKLIRCMGKEISRLEEDSTDDDFTSAVEDNNQDEEGVESDTGEDEDEEEWVSRRGVAMICDGERGTGY